MYFKVTKENDDRTFDELSNIEELQDRGMPIKVETEAVSFCVPDSS